MRRVFPRKQPAAAVSATVAAREKPLSEFAEETMRIVNIMLAVVVVGAAAALLNATGLARILPDTASAGQAHSESDQGGNRWCARLVWLRTPAVHASHGAP
jgi:hypothetical protein